MGCQLNCCETENQKKSKKSLLTQGPQFQIGKATPGGYGVPKPKRRNSDADKDNFVMFTHEPTLMTEPHQYEEEGIYSEKPNPRTTRSTSKVLEDLDHSRPFNNMKQKFLERSAQSMYQKGNPQAEEEGTQYIPTDDLNSYEEIQGFQNVSCIDIFPIIETELGEFQVLQLERVGEYIVLNCSDNAMRFIKLSEYSTPKSSSRFSQGSSSSFAYNVDEYLSFPDSIIAMAGGLLEKNQIVAIDLSNQFYKVDIEKREILYQTDKRDQGSFGNKICVMNSREENWMVCSKWTYEQNQIEIRNCDDFSLTLKFHVRSHVNYLIELNGNHKMRGTLMAGFSDGACGVYKINVHTRSAQFQCLLKSGIQYGMSVNTISEISNGRIAIGVSELIQIWDIQEQKLLKVINQDETIKSLLPLVPKNKSIEQILFGGGRARKAFVSTSLLVSANSIGKIAVYEVDDSHDSNEHQLLETQLEEMDEIKYLEQIEDKIIVCSGESMFRVFKFSVIN